MELGGAYEPASFSFLTSKLVGLSSFLTYWFRKRACRSCDYLQLSSYIGDVYIHCMAYQGGIENCYLFSNHSFKSFTVCALKNYLTD